MLVNILKIHSQISVGCYESIRVGHLPTVRRQRYQCNKDKIMRIDYINSETHRAA